MVYRGKRYETDAGIVVGAVGVDVTEGPGFTIDRPRGTQDFHLICFRSPVTLRLKGMPVVVRPGGCILYGPRSRQWYTGGTRSFTHDWIRFRGPRAERAARDHGPPLDTVLYPTTSALGIRDTLKGVYFSLRFRGVHWDHAAANRVHNLLILLKAAAAVDWRPPSETEDRIRAAHQALRADPFRQWRLSEMAAAAALSPKRFGVLYRRFIKATPLKTLIHVRMHHARDLLAAGELTVRQVAFECGYEDPAYFCRLFKRRFGVTPAGYRSSAPTAGGDS